MSNCSIKELNEKEKQLFGAIEQENVPKVKKLIENADVRINCLDRNGMSPLDQASFKGNEELVKLLLNSGANADNRAHDQGYTALMFGALSGKPRICQMLLEAGADAQAVNSISKTATELAAFTGQHECVIVISSYISRLDVDLILHPQGEASDPKYPNELVQFIHKLTRTHAFHPIRLAMDVAQSDLVWEHRKKVVWTVDRLFEKQLRTKQPNELLACKLWFILHTLRELLKFVAGRIGKTETSAEDGNRQSEEEQKLAMNFARILLVDMPDHLVRQNEERFIRNAIAAFPYKQLMLWQTLSKQFAQIPFGSPPSAFVVLCHALAGPRFVQTAHFCRTCYVPAAQKRCKNCKVFYCSVECQKLDWPIHKKCCERMKERLEEEEKMEQANDVPTSSINTE